MVVVDSPYESFFVAHRCSSFSRVSLSCQARRSIANHGVRLAVATSRALLGQAEGDERAVATPDFIDGELPVMGEGEPVTFPLLFDFSDSEDSI